jgi:acyl-CoA synthetase (NDP forming)
VIVEQPSYDVIVAFFTTVPGSAAIRPALKTALREVRRRHPDRLIVLSMLVPPELLRDYESEDYPIFEDANRAVRAVAALAFFAEAFARPVRKRGWQDLAPRPFLPLEVTEARSLDWLAASGVPVVAHRLCRTPEEAVTFFREVAAPVVMKISSPDIPHKTEVGGVAVGVASEDAVRRSHASLIERARQHATTARIDGVLVAPMVTDHVEIIVGAERNPVFGPMVMVGLGGIYAEVFHDVQFAPAPVDPAQAEAMLRRLRAFPLLTGVRGRPAADIPAACDLIARVSQLAAVAEDLQTLDINPVAVLPLGRGCLALDAGLQLLAADSPSRSVLAATADFDAT